MRRKIFRPFLMLCLILALAACNKKQWKETVPTHISLKMINPSIFFGVNELYLDTIKFDIESIVLDGSRIQADNIHLPAAINQRFTLSPNQDMLMTSLAIPQGTYESFQLSTKIGTPTSAIQIIGTYTLASGTVKKVNFELKYDQYLLNDLVENASSPVSIDKDLPGIIQITIDQNLLFANLNPSYWNSASSQNIGGQEVITVSNTSNTSMYNAVHSEIGQSISFIFE